MPSETLDLSRRVCPSVLPEWMDEPCTYEDFRACIRDIEQANRLMLGARPTMRWLARQAKRRDVSRPLRVLDVGSGGGDILRRIERWAKRRGIAVELTGIDLNPHATRAAREFTPAKSAIVWITGDAFSYAEPVDLVISSLVTHHLTDTVLVQFLAWMESVSGSGWYINDLCRGETPYKLFGLLAASMRWHHFVRNDGPVSVRRSFREEEWLALLQDAGIASHAVEMRRWTPARLCLSRTKAFPAPAARA